MKTLATLLLTALPALAQMSEIMPIDYTTGKGKIPTGYGFGDPNGVWYFSQYMEATGPVKITAKDGTTSVETMSLGTTKKITWVLNSTANTDGSVTFTGFAGAPTVDWDTSPAGTTFPKAGDNYVGTLPPGVTGKWMRVDDHKTTPYWGISGTTKGKRNPTEHWYHTPRPLPN